jgi:hypothetical protein
MDSKDAYSQGYCTSMGVVMQGEPGIGGWSGPLQAWQELYICGRVAEFENLILAYTGITIFIPV